MRELVRTNDAVLLSAIGALLDGAAIDYLIMDQHMSVLEGSLGVIPRRVLVHEDDLRAARQVMTDAGLAHARATLLVTRPTAVNLFWALDRMKRAADPEAEAKAIFEEDLAANHAIGAHGGSYGVYTALAMAIGDLSPGFRPDFLNTQPTFDPPAQPAWRDRFGSKR